MLPPGHIAGAYLATSAVLLLTHPVVSPEQMQNLVFIGIFFGIAPDLDFFYGFTSQNVWTIPNDKFDYKKSLSHAPLLWLLLAALIYFLARDSYLKEVGLLIWAGSWTHFLLDSIDNGVMWLYPFTIKRYALFLKEKKYVTVETKFFPFWIGLVRWYAKNMVSFWLEVATIVIAGVVVFTTK